jgi:hypothetical protein
MRKALFLMFIVCVAAWLTGCGDSKEPVVQPQISSFAFMQDAGGYTTAQIDFSKCPSCFSHKDKYEKVS